MARKITAYEAADGNIFKGKDECVDYEKRWKKENDIHSLLVAICIEEGYETDNLDLDSVVSVIMAGKERLIRILKED